MEAVKKYWFWGIFISILSIFAMSHNVSAMDFNYESYDIYKFVGRGDTTCISDKPETVTGNSYCSFDLNSNNEVVVKSIYLTNATTNLKAGDIVELNMIVRNNAIYSISGGAFGLIEARAYSNNMTVLKVETVENSTYQELFSSTVNLPGENVGYLNDVWIKPQLFRSYRITMRVGLDGDYNIGLTTAASGTRYIFRYYDTVNDSVSFVINNAVVYRPLSESKENREQEQKTQEAVDQSEAAGGSSSQDAQTGTTGLLNAITGAVNVISAARPTNCKINGNMGNLDMGQLDLCANPAPAFIQTIGSLILILMCVPLAISLFNRFIAIFRSFQS